MKFLKCYHFIFIFIFKPMRLFSQNYVLLIEVVVIQIIYIYVYVAIRFHEKYSLIYNIYTNLHHAYLTLLFHALTMVESYIIIYYNIYMYIFIKTLSQNKHYQFIDNKQHTIIISTISYTAKCPKPSKRIFFSTGCISHFSIACTNSSS